MGMYVWAFENVHSQSVQADFTHSLSLEHSDIPDRRHIISCKPAVLAGKALAG